MNKTTTCKYYLRNQCKFGANCFYSHDIIPQSAKIPSNTILSSYEDKLIPQKAISPSLALTSSSENLSDLYSFDAYNTTKPTLCKEFLIKTCSDQNCAYYHGYSDQFLNVSYIPCQESAIVGLCSISKTEFASCDKSTVKIWKIENKAKCIFNHSIEKGNIKKMIAIGNSILFTVHLDKYLTESTIIYLIIKAHLINITSKMPKINEIVFYDNILFCFGSNAIEGYSVYNDSLMFLKSINIANEIVTIATLNNLFFCGHNNGQMTTLQYIQNQNSFFNQVNCMQLHTKHINKLLIKTVDTNSNYLISVSEDKTIKVSNIEKGMIQVFMKMFSNQIENIFTSFNYFEEEVFCLCFDNGCISVLNNSFDSLFEISSHGNKVYSIL